MKLYNRETSYYTIITIPKCLVSKYGKKQIWRSLNTKDYKLAKLRAELETMSIRRKLLNDLNKQKEKNSKALDFAQILDDDDDDFFEDDNLQCFFQLIHPRLVLPIALVLMLQTKI